MLDLDYMLDLNWIRENPDKLDKNFIDRGSNAQSEKILDADKKWRSAVNELNNLRQKSKIAAKNRDIEEGKRIKAEIQKLEQEEKEISEELNSILSTVPNIISDHTPSGKDDNDNVEIKKWGNPEERNVSHDEIMDEMGLWINSADISGSRFAMMKGILSKLERSIANWMLDFNIDNGFDEISVPFIVKESALYNSGQLPKFRDDLFVMQDKALIPTGEVPLINVVQGRLAKSDEFPMRFTALSHCFRKEAGSAGRDTKGLIRLHQFQKVEIVSITTQDKSEDEHMFMLNHAEKLLQKLQLPYRIVEICSGDIGFTAKRQFDIEVWMAGVRKYVEISSCSNCGDFQARRMNTRYAHEGKKYFAHTLNCSALAVGRTLAAILENYYNKDERILHIPNVLQSYVGMESFKC
ncbi:serine--tRNA ligase [Candidatus Cytomitobacter indipagum]|uniref:Serine--tRNA ligase n=1 Tax=Candidatus Cytomitobacter indipagum TaxID=2601575 RepID=A0A5C0UEH7_9PROT|nr:serine--tRNA ligase [Candidatus Cytomitobacter indipagum]QEK38100.1 serine--tRNA ligase [Candidatus Cytomitobacter indipagum]